MLTPKQDAFVEEFLVDLNATKAAVRCGYSNKFANRQASQLLANPEIASAIDAAKSRRSLETGIDARWVLRRLVAESEADIADLFDDKNDLKPVSEWPPLFREGLVQSVEIDALYEGHGKDRVQIGHTKKLRLSDRLRRLELIGKHISVSAFQENVQHRGMDGLGERLERAFKREAEKPRLIEIAPASDAPGAVDCKHAGEVPQDDIPPGSFVPPAETAPPAPSPPQAAPYDPILPAFWPQEASHVSADYDPFDKDER